MAVKTQTGAVRITEPIARTLAEELELELVDVELAREHGSSFLRVLIDREGGLDLDTCEQYHRRLLPLVEHVEYDYLEVGSPGADRPLKKPRDFERMMGKRVQVRFYKPIGGKKEAEGTLATYSDGSVTIVDDAGASAVYTKGVVAQVRPVIVLEEADEGE